MTKAKDFDRLMAYIRGQTPQLGMFSTLDELLRVAPRENRGLQELREYLQPGRMLEAEGTQFPLKRSEIEATKLDSLLEQLGSEGDRINIEDLRGLVKAKRPAFGLTRGEEPQTYAEGGKISKIIQAAERFKNKKKVVDPWDPDTIKATSREYLPSSDEAQEWFKKSFAEFNRKKNAEIAATDFLYEPGDIVRGAKFRHEILYKSVDRKTGEPRYHVRNLETGAEYSLPEEGVVGKFEGPQKEYAEGGSVDEEEDQEMGLLRATAQSLANAIPFLSDDTRDYIGETITHVPSGMMSQTHGINPETGELEFALFNPASFIPTEEREANDRLDQIYQREMNRTQAIPGIIDETAALPLLGGMVGLPVPEWAKTAGDRTEDTREAVRRELGLKEPEGFFQNLADAGGMMLGQLPIPVEGLRNSIKPAQGFLKKAGRFMSATPRAGMEFLSPIIEPRVGNYIAGALFGGVLGSALEPGDVPPDIEALVEQAQEGDEESYQELLDLYEKYQSQQEQEERQHEVMGILSRKMAGGGKVRNLTELMAHQRKRALSDETELYEQLRKLERALEESGLNRTEIRKILSPRNEEFAGGGKVDMTRRAFLKGLGAAGVAAGSGKVALREGRLDELAEALESIPGKASMIPTTTRSFEIPVSVWDAGRKMMGLDVDDAVDETILDNAEDIFDMLPEYFDDMGRSEVNQMIRDTLYDDLLDAGASLEQIEKLTSQFRLKEGSFPQFSETDSGNIYHAGAYFETEIEGPQEILDKLNKFYESGEPQKF